MKLDLTPEEFELIDDYLQNELQGANLIAFEHQLKHDVVLQEKVKELQLLQLAIAESSLEADLETFYKQQPIHKLKDTKSFSLKIIALAVSMTLIIGFAFYYFLLQNKQALYTQYYKPDPGLITAMGSSDQYEFQKAMVEYKNGEYNSAIEAWKNQLKTNPQNDTLLYFLGAAYQANRNKDSAASYLLKVANFPNSAFHNDANWYLGLIYIQNKQKDKAVEYLKRSDHTKKEVLIQSIKKE